MGLFGLFGKKKESAQAKEMSRPPVPPSPLKLGAEESPIQPPQHVDDLGFGIGKEGKDESDISMPKNFDLPDLEFPMLKIPEEEEEIKSAIEQTVKPPFKVQKKSREIPSELPALEVVHDEMPEMPAREPEVELVSIEEPFELRSTPKTKGPVFIRSDHFKEMKNALISLRDVTDKAEETLNNVSEIKNREDSEYEAWHASAEAIQRKLLYIDRMLFE